MKSRVMSMLLIVALLTSLLNAFLPIFTLEANATAAKISTNIELVERALDVANNYKTLYVMGGWGQPLTAANKEKLIDAWSYNQQPERVAMINAASADTFAFDCVCLIKGLLWGWDGSLSDKNGGANYGSNGVSDVDATGMINYCYDISTDFSNIEVGEILWMPGHVGIYIGDGLAVECTPAWKNCVQITSYNAQAWTKHGKLQYVEYVSPCEHTYKGEGICSKCDYRFPWENTKDSSYAGTYTVTLSGGTYPRPSAPYSDSAKSSTLFPKGVKISVSYGVTNAYENLWYYATYNGVSGFVNSDNVTLDSRPTQQFTCLISSPTEGAVVPKSAYPVIGTLTSAYYQIKEVKAYIDGSCYATVSNVNATSLELRPTDVNYNLDFASLASGKHVLRIDARDSQSSSFVTVINRTFYTEGAHTCTKGEYLFYEAAHPHYKYWKCSICGESFTDGSTEFVRSCDECFDIYIKHWVSYEKMGDTITSAKVGDYVYFCYSLYDKNTGKTLNQLVTDEYNVKQTVYKPDGSIAYSYTFYCADSEWIGVTCYDSGTYTYELELSGDWTGTFSGSFTVNGNYSISYNANGGQNAPNTQTKEHGITINIPETVPTRFGYNFVGWSTSASSSTAQYQPGNSFTVNSDTTLYAVWKTASRLPGDTVLWSGRATIRYPGVGEYFLFVPIRTNSYRFYGEDSVDNKIYLYDANGNQLAADDDGGENRQFRLDYVMEAGQTYYIYVRLYSSSLTDDFNFGLLLGYPITYDANGGRGAPEMCYKYYGEEITLSSVQPTRTGYVFVGWNTEPSGSGTSYASGASYSGNDPLTLYAQWGKVCDVVGHNYVSTITPPTCSAQGYTTYACSVCGSNYVADTVAPTGHNYSYTIHPAVPDDPNDPEGEGRHSCQCLNCGDVLAYYEPHDWDRGAITIDPTCEEPGEITYTCVLCSAKKYSVLRREHHIVNDAAVPPTCTESGLTSGTHCDWCEKIFVEQEVIPPVGHNYDYAVDNGDGTHTAACDCGATVTEAHILMEGSCFCSTSQNPCGTCGDNMTWTLDVSTGLLTVLGSGTMNDYNYRDTPWEDYKNTIKTIVIEEGVTNIGQWAFANCRELTSVTIADSVIDIGGYAFDTCGKLLEVIIPENVATIGECAFCAGPESITVLNPNCWIYNGRNIDGLPTTERDQTLGSPGRTVVHGYAGSTAQAYAEEFGYDFVEIVEIESGTCGDNLIWSLNLNTGELKISGTGDMPNYNVPWNQYDDQIKSLVIEDGVTSIGDCAFNDCINLTIVVIAESVQSIGESAFENCLKLNDVIVPRNVVSIDACAFSICRSLTCISILNPDCYIYNGRDFEGLLNMCFDETLGIPGITVVHGREESTAQAYAEEFGYDFAILECEHSYGYINQPGADGYLDDEGSHRYECLICGDVAISFEPHLWDNGVVVHEPTCEMPGIVMYTCILCNAKKEGFVEKGHNIITDEAVAPTCTETGLTEGRRCSDCNELISGHEVVPALGHSYVYADNGDSHSVSCTNGCDYSATEPHDYSDGSCICGATDPYSGVCGEDVRWVLDVTTGQLTIFGTGAMTNYTSSKLVPWYNHRSLITSVTIEEGVTTVGDYIFRNLDNVTSMVLPNSITSVGINAFSHCNNLATIQLSKNLIKIEKSAFQDCVALTSVIIPGSVTSIGKDAFRCSGLTSVTIPDSSVIMVEDSSGLVNWVTLSGVTSIGSYAFYGCEKLTEVTVPQSVTSIGQGAFEGTTSLETIKIINKDCDIYGAAGTLGVVGTTTIYAYNDSTARSYAEKYGYVFVELTNCVLQGHDYGTPINNGDGTHTTTCACSDAITEDHTFVDGSCICGAVESTEPTLDSTLSFGANLVLENDLTMKFRVKSSKLTNYDVSTAYIVVHRDVYATGVAEPTVETMVITDYTVEGDRLVFSYPGIAAAQMNDNITAVLYIKDANGKEFVGPACETTSVGYYLNGLLGGYASDTKMVTLIMDMVNYGAAAQVYFDRHADALVNEAYENFVTYADYASADFTTALENLSTTEGADGKPGKLNLGLDLGTRIGIQYKVSVPTGVNVEDVTLVVTDAEGNVLETLAVAGNATDDRGRYIVNFYGNTSTQMRRMVYATAYANGEAITGTYGYTVSTYTWVIQENAALQPANLVNVTRMMMLYGDSAANYFS